MTLISVSVQIGDPSAADVFAYRGWVFLLAYDGRVLAYQTSQISGALVEKYGERGAAASYVLFSSNGIGAGPRGIAAWQRFDEPATMSLEIDPPEAHDLGFAVDSMALRDIHVYYNSLFVATDAGAWTASLSEDRRLLPELSGIRKLTSDSVESLNVGMGAVAASLGANGLAIYLDAWTRGELRETRLERLSLRSSLGWGKVANYPTDSSYEILDIESKRVSRASVLESVSPSQSDQSLVVLQDDVYALWDRGRLLVSQQERLESFGRAQSKSRRHIISSDSSPGSSLTLSVTGNHALVRETRYSLEVHYAGESLALHKGPVGPVRTYPQSRRYRRLVTTTVEGGVVFAAVTRRYFEPA